MFGPDGELIDVGIIEHWQNEADGLKGDHDALNEFYRQFPKTTEHAFRDEAKGSIFNLVKIYEQIDYNEEMSRTLGVTKGNFQWVNGIKIHRLYFIQIKMVDLKSVGFQKLNYKIEWYLKMV